MWALNKAWRGRPGLLCLQLPHLLLQGHHLHREHTVSWGTSLSTQQYKVMGWSCAACAPACLDTKMAPQAGARMHHEVLMGWRSGAAERLCLVRICLSKQPPDCVQGRGTCLSTKLLSLRVQLVGVVLQLQVARSHVVHKAFCKCNLRKAGPNMVAS